MRDPREYYKPGEWNAICDVCGFKFKSGELQRRWDGMMVCSADFETRHPQDFIRARREKTSVPWTRSEGTDMQAVVNPLDPDDVTYVDILGQAYIVIGNKLVFIGMAAARIGGDRSDFS